MLRGALCAVAPLAVVPAAVVCLFGAQRGVLWNQGVAR